MHFALLLSTRMVIQASKIPTTPGVYFFSNARGVRVYIGKALNLRNRLRQHPMLTKADHLDWQEIMGTICGDDTILIICRSPEDAENLKDKFIDMLQ